MRGRRWGQGLLAVALAASGVLAVAPAQADYAPTPRSTTWSPSDGRVYAIEHIGNTVFIGGSFTTLRSPDGTTTRARARLAAYDATTGDLLPWNPGANNEVRALQASSDGGGLFVGGAFTSIAGVARQRLAELSPSSGALLASFRTTANNTVLALERIDARLFVGGIFTTMSVGGVTTNRARLAAVDEVSGSFVAGWTASADNQVATLIASPDGARVFAGGRFLRLSGQSRDYVGAVDAATGAASPWRPPIPCTDLQNPCFVYDLAVDVGKVYAGVGGPGGRVVAYDIASGVRRWASYGDGDVQAIAVQGGVVYAGGHFDVSWAGEARAGLVALSSATGGLLTFGPMVLNGLGVFDILAEPDRLRVGGGFTRIDSTTQRARYAEFDAVAAPPDVDPPTVPTALRTTNVADTLVSLTWTASTDGTVVSGYQLVRDGQPVATLGTTSYTERGLTPATTYTYQVRASDAAGNWSALSAPLSVTTAPASTALVHVGSTWRYLSNGSDQGTAWREPGFNAAAWSSGDAQLGYGESDETTVISPLGLTHYFRQQFDVADPSVISALTVRLLRDDGAVVYVNGAEAWRSNLPDGPIGYQTSASVEVTGTAESTFVTQSVPTSLLVSGQNTIAVEVHNRTSSTDVSFDLELVPTFAPPGGGDTTPPTTPGGLHPTGTTTTTVSLAWEAATDDVAVTGYRVRRDGSVVATVPGLSWTDSGRTPGATHTYTVEAVDAAGNASPRSDPVSVTLPAPPGQLLGTGSTWRYRQATSPPDPTWPTVAYDDSSWPSGPSQLGFGDGDEATLLVRGARTYYFRTSFAVADPATVRTLSLSLLRDDGAVVYLNGTEVYRTNLPAGPVDYNTLASANVSGAAENAYFTFTAPPSLLVPGTNVVAVEVHQDSTASSDISLDLRATGG
jgi:trimeric autotransporter adhesin